VHLVGNWYKVYVTMHGQKNIKFTVSVFEFKSKFMSLYIDTVSVLWILTSFQSSSLERRTFFSEWEKLFASAVVAPIVLHDLRELQISIQRKKSVIM